MNLPVCVVRPDTTTNLKAMAMGVMGQETAELFLPQKAPMYTYAAAKVAVSNTEDDLFKATQTTKSSDDLKQQAYESVVRGAVHGQTVFPYSR